MAQLLNEVFAVEIKHTESTYNGKKKTWANVSSIGKPTTINGEGDEIMLNAPNRSVPLRLFIWDNPTNETWQSLYIDGEYKNDDGTSKSKNTIQEYILAGPEYAGSKLEAMLTLGNADYMDDVPF